MWKPLMLLVGFMLVFFSFVFYKLDGTTGVVAGTLSLVLGLLAFIVSGRAINNSAAE